MRRVLLAVLLLLPLLGLQKAEDRIPVELDQAPPPGVRFEARHVYIDTGEAPLAAYQLVVEAEPGRVKVVGIEGGEHAAYAEPPYYDAGAIQRETVVIADFSLASIQHLPRGRVRIATIHVLVNGEGDPEFTADVEVAASVDGDPIDAEVEITKGNES